MRWRHGPGSLLILSVLALYSHPVRGEQPPDRVWTEAAYLQAVLDQPAPSAVLDAPRIEAEAALGQARLFSNPDFSIEREEDAGRETTLALEWPLPLDGRRGLGIRAAEAALEASRHEVEGRRLGLRHELRAVYAAWALAATRRDLLAAYTERLGALVERAHRQADAGEISGLDAGRFRLEQLAVRSDLARAEAERRQRAAVAVGWLPASEPTPADPALPPLPPAPDDGTAPETPPEVAVRQARLDEARLSERLSRRFLRAPSLEVGWKTVEEGGMSANGPVIGLTWSLPLFDRNRPQRLAAEQRLEVAQAELDLTAARTAARWRAARQAYAVLRAEALDLDQTLDEREAAWRDAALAAFDHGESGVTELLDVLRSLLASRLSALDAYDSALEAHRDLELATGRPLPGTPSETSP